jgi:hypothetical protein
MTWIKLYSPNYEKLIPWMNYRPPYMEGKDNQDDPACHTVQLIEGDFGKR